MTQLKKINFQLLKIVVLTPLILSFLNFSCYSQTIKKDHLINNWLSDRNLQKEDTIIFNKFAPQKSNHILDFSSNYSWIIKTNGKIQIGKEVVFKAKDKKKKTVFLYPSKIKLEDLIKELQDQGIDMVSINDPVIYKGLKPEEYDLYIDSTMINKSNGVKPDLDKIKKLFENNNSNAVKHSTKKDSINNQRDNKEKPHIYRLWKEKSGEYIFNEDSNFLSIRLPKEKGKFKIISLSEDQLKVVKIR